MERMNENENKDTFAEMSITELVNFINEAYNERQSMDLSYTYAEETDLIKAMTTLERKIGYGE